MSEAIKSLSDAIERMYRSFVLRDLLGYVLPGSVFLLSVWILIGPLEQTSSSQSHTDGLNRLMEILGKNWSTLQVFAFLGASYLTGLVLQSVHYGLVDWIYQMFKHRKCESFFWPITGTILYAKAIGNGTKEPIPSFKEPIPSLMTIGALDPDKALKKLKGTRALSRLSESAAYTERLSILALMTGNTAIAGIPLLIVLKPIFRCWTIVGVLVLLFLYLEHWRLLYVRNLRHELIVDAASQENETVSE